MDQSFGKEYKLCSKKTIQQLFQNRKTVKHFPFVATYDFAELTSNKSFQVVISVPKRLVKKAHDRNRIKRQIREVFRKNKLILEHYLENEQQQIAIFLVITKTDELTYSFLEHRIKGLFYKLVDELKSKNDTKNK
jgi:ribonuclease P protein component